MPPVVHLLLILLSLVCFVLSAFPSLSGNWQRLVSAGLAFLVASMIQW
jgi:hypothetical protein